MQAEQLELLPYTKEEKNECDIYQLRGDHAHLRRSFFARHGEHEKRIDKLEGQMDQLLSYIMKNTSERPVEDTTSAHEKCQVYYI